MSDTENMEENSFMPAGDPIKWDSLDGDPITPGFHTAADPQYAKNSKYPNVVGTGRLSVTDTPSGDIPKRSWMGWFLWGDGTPPPGVTPGIPGKVDDPSKANNDNWDYFSWQYRADEDKNKRDWKAQRLDQQPLYLNPLRINNNWPCGRFGYVSTPLQESKAFKNNYNFWADKKIVRGPNISMPYPYFEQYTNKKEDPVPKEWQNSWLYLRTKPLETLVLVPSCMTPDELMTKGVWNNNNAPFPYPVWDNTLTPDKQTPYNIKVDRVGDWDADIVWEGTNKDFDEHYLDNRYQRTEFKEAGKGKYLKMTVAQGAPFVWCETNGNKYSIFYNLIQVNVPSAQTSNFLNPSDKFFGPYQVPGVTGVSFVLMNGDQTNPNQPYQEVEPFGWDSGSGKIGGWNPPNQQHSRTFIAIFYREDTVKQPVSVDGKSDHFFLEHLNEGTGKNWYVVAPLPLMHYYNTNNRQDIFPDMLKAAEAWANELGKYAFNFLTQTKISYEVTNMYKVCTTYATTLKNPFQEANPNDPAAAAMTADGNLPSAERKTVMALMPHHYQPIGLGPDLTQAGNPELQWHPLLNEDTISFPTAGSIPKLPHANKSDSSNTEGRWGYWTPKGNMKTILAGSFSTQYLFQNFLPFMPPPKMDKTYKNTGIQAVKITDVGSGNHDFTNPKLKAYYVEVKATVDASQGGSGAKLEVILDEHSDQIKQIYVTSQGSGYPQLKPGGTRLSVSIDKPTIKQGTQATAQATAWAQVGGSGEILAVFMLNKGSGYRSVIKVKKIPSNADQPVIFPPFDKDGNLISGLATVLLSGAGFDFSNGNKPELEFWGTGTTPATAEVIGPGEILEITPSIIGGYTDAGAYPVPSDKLEDVSSKINVHIPPPNAGTEAQKAEINNDGLGPSLALLGFWIKKAGTGLKPEMVKKIYFKNGESQGNDITTQLNFTFNAPPTGAGQLTSLGANGTWNSTVNTFPKLAPVPVVFIGQDDKPIDSIEAYACPQVGIQSVALSAGSSVSGYQNDVPVSFSGGDLGVEGFEMPSLDFTINPGGDITLNGFNNNQNGKGFLSDAYMDMDLGRGFDAELATVMRYNNSQGELVGAIILNPGSHYPDRVDAFVQYQNIDDNTETKPLSVKVTNGQISSVELKNGISYAGMNLNSQPIIRLVQPGQTDFVNYPPKGPRAQLHFAPDTNNPGGLNAPDQYTKGVGYVPGAEYKATIDSPPVILKNKVAFVLSANQAANYIARVLKPEIKVDQVLFDSLVFTYTQMSSDNLAPFGGGFGIDGRDGYGMGGVLSSSAKVLGIMYHFFRYYEDKQMDVAPLIPSAFAYNPTKLEATAPKDPLYINNNPLISLQAAMKVMTQAMQRTFTLLFQKEAFKNVPASDADWSMHYFAFYDEKAGRTLMNPTSTIPGKSIMSAVIDPADISDTENKGKTGLKRWEKGMLWSGFGVSDQWNDQHYFYGYYLSAAAIFALLDQAWLKDGEPAALSEWADQKQMGTAIDQMMMTLAYDPDLKDSYYNIPGMNYGKYSFFDRWNGHSWATGVAPGIAGPYSSGDFNTWRSRGNGNYPFNDENENSIWEGIQAWSSILLWGGATRRKAIVDQGIYLMATGNAAADLYFLDKNYNLQISENNLYSWCPVTTGNPQHYDGGNKFDVNTDYGTANYKDFYGEAAAGVSTIYKGCIGLNNFFYDYPTGSKTIQAFPPTPWTLGICRNTSYMKKWAEAMRLPAWADVRNSELYSASDWLSMAMTSAMCGVPYNPGDQVDPSPDTYVNRLWSSWVTRDQAAGANATVKPMETPLSVLNFLHTLDVYGAPDWTIYAKVVDKSGKDADQEILYSASFSKVEGSQVTTSFVAFNPNWESRYINFYRITSSNGQASLDNNTPLNDTPIEVGPKKMEVLTKTFDKQ